MVILMTRVSIRIRCVPCTCARARAESDDSDADVDNEQLAQVLMRIIDLLVRHGGRCSADDTPRGTYNKGQDFLPWILSRADCTAAIRDAVNQGNLVY